MGSGANNYVCLARVAVAFAMAYFVVACSQEVTPSSKAVGSSVAPSLYQPHSPIKSISETRIEGAWHKPNSVKHVSNPVGAGKEIRIANLDAQTNDELFLSIQLYSSKNLQTGLFDIISSERFKLDEQKINWTSLENPVFSNAAGLNSNNELIKSKTNSVTGNEISIWRSEGEYYLVDHDPQSNLNEFVKLSTNASSIKSADLSVLQTGNVLSWWLEGNSEQNKVNLIEYDANLKIVRDFSVNLNSSFPHLMLSPGEAVTEINLVELSTKLMLVLSISTESGMKLYSISHDAELGWNAGGEIPVNIAGKKHQDLILIGGAESNKAKIILTSSEINSGIQIISFDGMRWGDQQRLDNGSSGYRWVSGSLAVDTKGGGVALSWLSASENAQRVEALSVNVLDSHIGLPLNMSGDVKKGVGSVLRTPSVSLMNDDFSVSWVMQSESGVELFASHYFNGKVDVPELIFGTDSRIETLTGHRIIRLRSGEIFSTWLSKKRSLLEDDYTLWVSQNINGGELITPDVRSVKKSPEILANPVIQAAHWGLPENVWSINFPGNFEHHIYGPDLYLKSGNEAYLSIHRAVGYDPAVNEYQNMQTTVLHQSGVSPWIEESPSPAGATGITFVEIEQVENTGDAYGLWTNNGLLFFSHFIAGQGWQAEQALGFETYHYHLMVNSSGNAVLFFISQNLMHLMEYVPGVGMQPPESFLAEKVLYYAKPLILANDTVFLSWIGFPDIGATPYVPSNILNSVVYVPGTGWGTPNVAQRIESFNYLGNRVESRVLANGDILAISQDTQNYIYSNVYSMQTGWGVWQNVDYNLDLKDRILARPRVSSNSGGDVMVTWSEKTTNELGETVFRVYSNQFNPVADVAGSNWGLPQRIASLAPLDNNGRHVEIHPKIALGPTGRAVAAWIDEDDITSRLLVNDYTPGTGWAVAPDTLASYNKATEGQVDAARVAIANDEVTLVSWRQHVRSEFATDYHVWVAAQTAPP